MFPVDYDYNDVFRTAQGVIDHTSLLKTIEVRWNLPPLTARDKAAPDIGDVLSTPRTDDPLAGVVIPPPAIAHPNSSQPSRIDKLHAQKVEALPLRNEKGAYASHTPPDLTSGDAISDYIQTRTAAWTQHLQRLRARKTSGAKNVAVKPTRARKKSARTRKKAAAKRKKRR